MHGCDVGNPQSSTAFGNATPSTAYGKFTFWRKKKTKRNSFSSRGSLKHSVVFHTEQQSFQSETFSKTPPQTICRLWQTDCRRWNEREDLFPQEYDWKQWANQITLQIFKKCQKKGEKKCPFWKNLWFPCAHKTASKAESWEPILEEFQLAVDSIYHACKSHSE